MNAEQARRARGRPSQGGREAILDATLALIAEQGLARTTTSAIAERAGVSEASIYYHFADKPALLEAVIFDAILAPLDVFTATFPGRSGGLSVRDALTEYGDALEAFWLQILPVLSAVQADAELLELFRDRIGRLGIGPQRSIRIVGDYLAAQQQRGTVRRDMEPHAAAMSFAGACFLSAYQRHMFGNRARRKLPRLAGVLATLTEIIGE